MIRSFLAIRILIVLTISISFLSFAGKTIPLTPINGKEIQIVLNGAEKKYYSLSKGNPIKVKVNGPTKLEMITRLILPKDGIVNGKYSIKVVEKSTTVKHYSTSTEKSDAFVKNPNMILGKSRKFTMDVPEGNHTYEYYLESDNAADVAIKFSIKSKKGKNSTSRVELQPLIYEKVVTAIIKENLISYYVASKQKDVEVRVIGPTKLQITGRLNFDVATKGIQKYAVSVWENENKLFTKPLSTTKSLGVSYQEWKDVVPGKPDKIYLDVPSGEHLYKFKLEETSAHSISLKFLIPKKDLDNEG